MQEEFSFSKERATDLISKQMTAKGRKYYFDLKRNSKGGYYYTISETQPHNKGFKRMRLVIHKEYLSQFMEVLNELQSDSLQFFNES